MTDPIPSSQTTKGPHILVREESLPWLTENAALIVHPALKYVGCTNWVGALQTIESYVFSQPREQIYLTARKSIRELLPQITTYVDQTSDDDAEATNYKFDPKVDLDRPFVECLQASEKTRTVQENPYHALTALYATAHSQIRLANSIIPQAVEKRVRSLQQLARERVLLQRVATPHYRGFAEIAEVFDLGVRQQANCLPFHTYLVFDFNGFGGFFQYPAQRVEWIKEKCYVATWRLTLPIEKYPTMGGMVLKDEIDALYALHDRWQLAPQFLDFLAQQSLGNPHCSLEGLTWEKIIFLRFLRKRLRPLFESPTRGELLQLHSQGAPPYTAAQVLQLQLPTEGYSYDWNEPLLRQVAARLKLLPISKVIQELETDPVFLNFTS